MMSQSMTNCKRALYEGFVQNSPKTKTVGLKHPFQYRVQAGSLAFSVALFIVGSIVCIGLMQWRRFSKRVGGELGGPMGIKVRSFLEFLCSKISTRKWAKPASALAFVSKVIRVQKPVTLSCAQSLQRISR